MDSGRLLILSDGKPGHLNQSIAFAKHLGCDYDICSVSFKNRLCKAVSYLFDRCYLQFESLYRVAHFSGAYRAVLSAGSETYYANRVIASKLGIKSVAIMLPKGYRYDFELIVAQQHDDPPERDNLVCLPINLSYVEPKGLVAPESGHRYVSLIIGGDSKHSRLDPALLQRQVEEIFVLFPEHDFWLTTSRRTTLEVEAVLRQFNFSREVYYSEEQLNPIPDFLAHSEYVFLTADSTSMISEAVSCGTACVEILSAGTGIAQGKIGRFLRNLSDGGYIHYFDGSLGNNDRKVNVSKTILALKPGLN